MFVLSHSLSREEEEEGESVGGMHLLGLHHILFRPTLQRPNPSLTLLYDD